MRKKAAFMPLFLRQPPTWPKTKILFPYLYGICYNGGRQFILWRYVMGRMLLLDQIINPANNQVEGFCIVRSVVQKSNVKEKAAIIWTLSCATRGAK